jgi:hypothetical protein
MAGELRYDGKVGEGALTLYAVLVNDATGARWNTSGSPAWDAATLNITNQANHAIALVESPILYWAGDFPAGIAAGLLVNVYICEQSGASAAVATDIVLARRMCLTLGGGAVCWDPVDVATIKGSAITMAGGTVSIGLFVGNAGANIAVDANGKVTYSNAAPPTVQAIRGEMETSGGILSNTYSAAGSAASSAGQAASSASSAYGTALAAYNIVNHMTYGNSPLLTAVQNIQNNTSCRGVVPTTIPRPTAGTQTYRIELLLYDEIGNMEAPDAPPTVAVVNSAGTSRASRLDSTTMTLVSAGRYRAVYTASSTDDIEELNWTFSATEGGQTRVYAAISNVVVASEDIAALATAQDVADAFTEIKGATWSATNGTLDAIGARAAQIGAATVTWTSPAATGGAFVIFAGDDYLGARALTVAAADYAGPDLTGATAVLRCQTAESYDRAATAAAAEFVATLTVDGTTVTAAVELTAEQTAALATWPPAEHARNYAYQLLAVTAGGRIVTLAAGRMTVRKGITAT